MTMNERYEPQSIESRWQKRWEEAGVFRAGRRPGAEPRYVLEMFPYPSGAMHMGHVRVYTIGDVLARYLRMRGYDVLHPIGFDALGLPAENAAIKDGAPPGRADRREHRLLPGRDEAARATPSTGSARSSPADPEYYRWNQWFFVKMLEKGIVYRRQGKANWCTGCITVIANEQVVDDDRCERCSSPVVEKVIPEWAFRITAYAEALLDGLDELHRLARAHHHHAAQLDRQELGGRRGRLRGGRPARSASRSSPPASTPSTAAPTWCWRRSTRWWPQLTTPGAQAEVEAFVARMRKTRRPSGPAEERAQGGRLHRRLRGQPVHRRAGAGLDRQLRAGRLRHRRGHERAGPRPARLRVRQEVRRCPSAPSSSRPAGERPRPATRSAAASTEDGVPRAPARSPASPRPRRARAWARTPRQKGFGEATVRWHLRDWGFSRQRYWGTPIPIVYCDGPRRGAGAGGPAAGQAAARGASSPAPASRRSPRCRRSSTPPARPAAGRPGARPRRWTPSSTRPGTTRATCRPRRRRAPVRPGAGEALAAGGRLRRRPRARRDAPALLPLLAPGHAASSG